MVGGGGLTVVEADLAPTPATPDLPVHLRVISEGGHCVP